MRTADARGCHHSQVEWIRDADHLRTKPKGHTVIMCPGFLHEHPDASNLVRVARERGCYVIQSDKFNPVQRRA